MKNYRRIKKFGAAVTAVAMLGTLSVGVFADEVDPADELGIGDFIGSDVSEDVIVPDFVKDMEEDLFTGVPIIEDDIDVLGEGEGGTTTEEPTTPAESAKPYSNGLLESTNLTLKGVSLTKKADNVEAETPVYTYTAAVKYEINTTESVAGKQVAVVGYTFTGDETVAAQGGLKDGSAIYAIDQIPAEKEGTLTLKMSTASPKAVDPTGTLILKIGSDVVENCAPQAVAVNLAAAEDITKFTATYAEASRSAITVAPGTSEDAVKATLANLAITVYDSSAKKFSEGGFTAADWAVKSGSSYTGAVGSSAVFEGTVQANANAERATLGTDLIKVEVTVNVDKLTAGAIKAEPIEIKDSVTELPTDLADLFGTAGVTIVDDINNPVVTDTPAANQMEIAWKNGTALVLGKAGNKATLVVTIAAGETANGKFNLTNSIVKEVEITVAASITGIYGDVDSNGEVDDSDWGAIMLWTLNGKNAALNDNTSAAYKAADVDGNGEVDDSDWGAIMLWTLNGKNQIIGTNF